VTTEATSASVAEEINNQYRHVFELLGRGWSAEELSGPRHTAEPQEMYVDLMARCPVRDLGDQYYSVTKMADVQYVTRHPDVKQGTKYLGSDRPAIPLGLDGEEHRKYRRLLDPVFTPHRVAPLADSVRALANELIDGFIEDKRVDAYRSWCEPLPSTIFLSIMGLPMETLDDFLRFKDLTLSNDADVDFEEGARRRNEGAAWLNAYFSDAIDQRIRRGEPGDDMLGWLITSEVDGHRLGRDELLGILSLLMIAGLDTVAASLACFLSYLARNPEQRARLHAEPTLWRSAIEELMRFESPVTEGFRVATAEITLPSGTTIPANSYIHVSWSAADLDPDVFVDPLTVDLARDPNPHIGFASGYHRCLGSHLARMEMVTALQAWHTRIPDYRIADDAAMLYTGNPRAPHKLALVWD
jgi:cytochrome P450